MFFSSSPSVMKAPHLRPVAATYGEAGASSSAQLPIDH